MKRGVVVDVDAGSDDAVALLLLLTCEPATSYRLLAVTCTHGNAALHHVCRNVLTTLHTVNRLDVPVYAGAEGPLVPIEDPDVVLSDFHGKDGFGDNDFPPVPGSVQNENAVPALNRMARESDGITLICLGPLTNIALTLRTYPKFSEYVKEVYIMGGNTTGIGNSSSAAEFNFYKDPEAAHIVLSTFKCPITVLPWESCTKHNFTAEERFQKIASISTPQIKLLNAIESKIYRYGHVWNPCDGLLAGIFLEKSMIVKSRQVHMSVELHGLYTRGQAVIDHLRKKAANVRIVDEIDVEVFKKLVYKMASYSF